MITIMNDASVNTIGNEPFVLWSTAAHMDSPMPIKKITKPMLPKISRGRFIVTNLMRLDSTERPCFTGFCRDVEP